MLPITSTVMVQLAPAATLVEKPDVTLIRSVPGKAEMVRSPQEVVKLEGEAITIPVGKLSVKIGLSKLVAPAVLSIVNVSVLRSPKFTVAGLKLLVNIGQALLTVKLAEAVPLFPELEVRSPVVLVCVPAVLLVTFTLIVQNELAPILPSLTLIDVPPAGAIIIASVHELVMTGGEAIVIPAGKLSIKAKSVTPVPDEVLLIVNVKVLTLPGPISVVLKDLEKLGGNRLSTSTSSLAEFPPNV